MERDQALIADWPTPLKKRQGGDILLDGIEVWHDFDWLEVMGHDRGVFRNCKSIGRKIKQYTPEGSNPVLLLTQRPEITGYSVRTGADGQLVHTLNVREVLTVAADAADTLVGHQASPDFDIGTTIRQLEEIPQAIDELIARNLGANRVLEWATRDDESVREITDALSVLDAAQLSRAVAIAFAVVARAGNWPSLLSDFSLEADGTILTLAAAGATYTQQSMAVAHLESLLTEKHSESTYQDFFEENSWMFGSRFVGRWPGRQITLGDQQDFILQTADGFFDLIELKLPSDAILRWDPSHKSYYPSPTLSKALGQVQKYLLDVDKDMYRIRSEFALDVHRARAVIVIGQLDHTDDGLRQALRTLNSHLNRIEVWTYTQVLAMARAILEYTGSLLT